MEKNKEKKRRERRRIRRRRRWRSRGRRRRRRRRTRRRRRRLIISIIILVVMTTMMMISFIVKLERVIQSSAMESVSPCSGCRSVIAVFAINMKRSVMVARHEGGLRHGRALLWSEGNPVRTKISIENRCICCICLS